VLSLGKLAPGQQEYYLDTVARGAEEYYTGAKEAPGQWIGGAAARLGLSGEVDAAALGRVLDHVHPDDSYRLTAARSVPTVAGFDATFCAPKSVSLLFALGDPEASNEVRNAADAAVRASFEVLEGAACRVRRGKGGHTVLDADGFVAASFRHRTSRAGDPHLHTHVVIGNLAYASIDEKWSALDGRPLYSWLSPVGHLYNAHLRWELTQRLGVQWRPIRNGVADIDGFSTTVLREFSTRRREIEMHMEEHGLDGPRAAQLAAYATRRPKETGAAAEALLPWWQERAEAIGFDPDALQAVLGRTLSVDPPTPGSPQAADLYRWLASADGLTARKSTFGERDVIKAVCNALPTGGRVDQILELVQGFVTSDHVLAISADRAAAMIRLRDGTTVPARTDEMRWTTPEMLELETWLVDTAARGRASHVGTAAPDAVDAALEARPTLSEEQVAMVRTICLSGDRIEIVEGVAGAGKTFALATARDAWEASGYRVIGCSLAARAAKQLERDAGIPSWTIDRLLGELDRSDALDAATVLVVDEAAMVGTRKLARLVEQADAVGAKLVLVGDPCQLPEIEAGGVFVGLRSRLGGPVLTENRRQTDAWERDALSELRHGDPDRALKSYIAHDRVHVASSENDAREQIVDEWMNVRAAGDDVLMVAPRLADVDDLNRRARTMLRDEGYLGDDRVVLAGRAFTEGDEILALRNDYRVGLLNGTRGVIEEINVARRTLTVRGDDGQQLAVPFDYAEAGHLTHGYATTIHKAQGTTVDRCLVLLDETGTREHVYTALSRGRHGNDVFIAQRDRRVEESHAAELEVDALDALRSVMGRSAAQRLALDQVEPTSTPLTTAQRLERLASRSRSPGQRSVGREL
jgi:conjugative relaxase-like TrwC/TraI family protein